MQDSMWNFLTDGKQEANIEALESAVHSLISMTTQKDGGQRKNSKGISFDLLDLTKWQIICEATALVLSGKLDALKEGVCSGG